MTIKHKGVVLNKVQGNFALHLLGHWSAGNCNLKDMAAHLNDTKLPREVVRLALDKATITPYSTPWETQKLNRLVVIYKAHFEQKLEKK